MQGVRNPARCRVGGARMERAGRITLSKIPLKLSVVVGRRRLDPSNRINAVRGAVGCVIIEVVLEGAPVLHKRVIFDRGVVTEL